MTGHFNDCLNVNTGSRIRYISCFFNHDMKHRDIAGCIISPSCIISLDPVIIPINYDRGFGASDCSFNFSLDFYHYAIASALRYCGLQTTQMHRINTEQIRNSSLIKFPLGSTRVIVWWHQRIEIDRIKCHGEQISFRLCKKAFAIPKIEACFMRANMNIFHALRKLCVDAFPANNGM